MTWCAVEHVADVHGPGVNTENPVHRALHERQPLDPAFEDGRHVGTEKTPCDGENHHERDNCPGEGH